VLVVELRLPAGDFLLNATVDLANTIPIAQQYTCQLKVADTVEPIDYTPIIYGLQTRLSLSGTVHIYVPTQVTVSCGSDAPARVLKGRLTALQVDHITAALSGATIY
jgi:hypothetical protein